MAHAGDVGSEVYLVLQSEQIHAGCGGAGLVRDWHKRMQRSQYRGRRQRQLGGVEAPMTSN